MDKSDFGSFNDLWHANNAEISKGSPLTSLIRGLVIGMNNIWHSKKSLIKNFPIYKSKFKFQVAKNSFTVMSPEEWNILFTLFDHIQNLPKWFLHQWQDSILFWLSIFAA